MEQWDKDYIDLVVPGYFEFRKSRTGEFQFGVVEGDIDYRLEKTDNREGSNSHGWVTANMIRKPAGVGQ